MIDISLQYILSQDADFMIRCELADNKNTDPNVLKKMEKENTDIRILCGIARNPNTLPETFEALFSKRNLEIWIRLAYNEKTPPNILERLVDESLTSDNNYFRYCLAENPNTPGEALRKLFKLNVDPEIKTQLLYRLAENPNTPDDICKTFTQSTDANFKFKLAKNPSTPSETLDILFRSAEPASRLITLYSNIAENKNTSAKTLEALSKSLDSLDRDEKAYILQCIIRNPNTSEETLRDIYNTSKDYFILQALRGNPNTPQSILDKLDGTGRGNDRKSDAKTNPRRLAKLAKANDYRIRLEVAGDPNTPKETLTRLAKDNDLRVQWVVALNPKTNLNERIRLLKMFAPFEQRDLAGTPDIPPEILRLLGDSKDFIVQLTLAWNPSTPLDMQTEIAKSQDWMIKIALMYSKEEMAFYKLIEEIKKLGISYQRSTDIIDKSEPIIGDILGDVLYGDGDYATLSIEELVDAALSAGVGALDCSSAREAMSRVTNNMLQR